MRRPEPALRDTIRQVRSEALCWNVARLLLVMPEAGVPLPPIPAGTPYRAVTFSNAAVYTQE
jgi:hypothetical protein